MDIKYQPAEESEWSVISISAELLDDVKSIRMKQIGKSNTSNDGIGYEYDS